MTDRELLEKAAKAAGITDAEYQDMTGWGEVRYGFDQAIWSKELHNKGELGYWNPLADDGDAFRLMVRLGFNVEIMLPRDSKELGRTIAGRCCTLHGDDPAAATRRAIVRAAAALTTSA